MFGDNGLFPLIKGTAEDGGGSRCGGFSNQTQTKCDVAFAGTFVAAERGQSSRVKEGVVRAIKEAVTGGADAEGPGDLGLVVEVDCQAGDLRGVFDNGGAVGCCGLVICMIFGNREDQDCVKGSGGGVNKEAFEFGQGCQSAGALRVSEKEQGGTIASWSER